MKTRKRIEWRLKPSEWANKWALSSDRNWTPFDRNNPSVPQTARRLAWLQENWARVHGSRKKIFEFRLA